MSFVGMLATTGYTQQPTHVQSLPDRVSHMGDSDIEAYVNTRLDRGLGVEEHDRMGLLIMTRGSLVLPIIEKRIEQILKSSNPRDCFIDKNVNPDSFIALAASSISWAGDLSAMRELSKLVVIDEKRFGTLVGPTLYTAANKGNPFVVAYGGLSIGNPGLDRRILEWI
ncbi:MAG TPA: hypothetical protein VG456_15620, partial [Candidatus Sulfopaludibacter sp.]|nr:hypothetical protein [Candidatus Sulfopaludibacter sp.]